MWTNNRHFPSIPGAAGFTRCQLSTWSPTPNLSVGFWRWETRPQQWPAISTSESISRITHSFSLSLSKALRKRVENYWFRSNYNYKAAASSRLQLERRNCSPTWHFWKWKSAAVIPNWRSASNHAWLWPAIRAGWKFINPGQFMVVKNHPPGPSHPFSPSFNCHFGDTPSSPHTGKFPKMWVPLQHPFINRTFHYKPSSYWGTAILRKPPTLKSWGIPTSCNCQTAPDRPDRAGPRLSGLVESLRNIDNTVFSVM